MGKALPKIAAEAEAAEELLPGVVLPQYVRCGKRGCRCAGGSGTLHGPYLYRFWREEGRLKKRYVPRRDSEQVQSACRAWQEHKVIEREVRARVRENRGKMRAMIHSLREMEAALRMMRGL